MASDHDPIPSPTLPDAAATGPGPTYGRTAARGMAWTTLATLVGKAAAFVAQFLLGMWLGKGDWELYAAAIGFTALIAALRDGGTHRLLIQQSRRFGELARPVLRIALGFNLAAAAIFIAASPLAAGYYQMPGLPPLMLVMALAMPLGTPAMVYRARLSADLRFRELAQVETASMVLRHASTILFALAGLGPYSFVLPALATALFEWAALHWLTGAIPRGAALTWGLFRQVFAASGWIMLAAPAISLITQGDYLVIGRLRRDLLADYFFGYQLTASITVMFSGGLMGVMMPTLSRLSGDRARQAAAFVRASRLLWFLATPVCVGIAVISAPLLHVLWDGKWDAAAPVVRIMSLTLMALLFTPLAVAAIEARGRWGWRAGILIVHALTTVAAAALGCHLGGITAIALCVGLQHALQGLFQGLVAGRMVGVGPGRFFAAILPSLLASLAAGAAAYGLIEHAWPIASPWGRLLALGGLFTALTVLAWLTVLRASLREVLELAGLRGPSARTTA